jgi:hypothetical protein
LTNRSARRSRTATAALALWNVPVMMNGLDSSASTSACSGGRMYAAASSSYSTKPLAAWTLSHSRT